jgi:hypothetical protein
MQFQWGILMIFKRNTILLNFSHFQDVFCSGHNNDRLWSCSENARCHTFLEYPGHKAYHGINFSCILEIACLKLFYVWNFLITIFEVFSMANPGSKRYKNPFQIISALLRPKR